MMIFLLVFLLGLIIGSFLNAVIYRLPRGISLLHPKRSFCPACKHSLAWWENLPLLSWLFLRGRCDHCRAAISWRYPLIELITGILFLACYWTFGFPLAIAYAVFVSLLIAATAIDFELLIIPHEITWGGVLLGVVASTLLPSLMRAHSPLQGLLFSLGSAGAGYLLLWGVLELGKKAFGKQRLRFKEPQLLELKKNDTVIMVSLQGEEVEWRSLFPRPKDKVVFQALSLEMGGETFANGKVELSLNNIKIDHRTWALEEALPLQGTLKEITLPREAMGFGDVNFLACIGAFLGWKGMLCSLFLGSIIGAIIGSLLLVLTRGRVGKRIPFGPYLSLGAFLWMMKGNELLHWYLGLFHLRF